MLALDILIGLGEGLLNLARLPWTLWQWLQIETPKERMVALTLAGQSLAFLYTVLAAILLVLVAGIASRRFLIGTVLALEGFNRAIGRTASWVVLLLMLQQVLIIITGQVFRGNELLFSPLGMTLSNAELQWLSGQLKFYNAILIALASAWTFVEGGHVRVDLVYGNVRRRLQLWLDLFGSVFFMLPTTILLWWFSWPLLTNAIFAQRPMNIFSSKASWRGVRLETSGTAEFTWVWAFKALILVFAFLLVVQSVAFMLRNVWALLERRADIESHPSGDPPVLEPAPAVTDGADGADDPGDRGDRGGADRSTPDTSELDVDIDVGRTPRALEAPIRPGGVPDTSTVPGDDSPPVTAR